MKLKNSSLILSFLLLGTFAVISLTLTKVTDLLEVETNELARASESISVAQSLKIRLLTHNRNSFLFNQHRDPVRFESRTIQRREIGELLKEANDLVGGDEEVQILKLVEEEIGDYLSKRDKHENETISPLVRYNLISQDVDNAIIAIDKLININRVQMKDLLSKVSQQNIKADQISIILLGIGILLVSSLLLGIFLYVTRPLEKISKRISKYKDGQNSERLVEQGPNEIKVIASNFNLMADKLEERRQDQLRFIASIAHDLRNPLNSMAMASELLVTQTDSDSAELSKILFNQVKNLDRLVGDLLDSTRIEAGQLKLSLTLNDINQLIREAVKLHQISSKLHVFKLLLSAEGLSCSCDPTRLSQVLNNLISNALKYSPNGDEIEVSSESINNQILIKITDHGIGIAEEDIENIFQPFHRTKATRDSIPGIGLGLAASRKIVEAHGGRLWVSSSLSKGSTFHIQLPKTSARANGELES